MDFDPKNLARGSKFDFQNLQYNGLSGWTWPSSGIPVKFQTGGTGVLDPSPGSWGQNQLGKPYFRMIRPLKVRGTLRQRSLVKSYLWRRVPLPLSGLNLLLIGFLDGFWSKESGERFKNFFLNLQYNGLSGWTWPSSGILVNFKLIDLGFLTPRQVLGVKINSENNISEWLDHLK